MLVDLSRGLPTPDWSLTYPQLIVFGLALLLMVLDAFVPRRHHYGLLTGVSLIGYGLAAAALWTQDGQNEATFWWSFRADGLSVFLSLVILVSAVLSVAHRGVVRRSARRASADRRVLRAAGLRHPGRDAGRRRRRSGDDLRRHRAVVAGHLHPDRVRQATTDRPRRRHEVLPARHLRLRHPGLRHGLGLRADRHDQPRRHRLCHAEQRHRARPTSIRRWCWRCCWSSSGSASRWPPCPSTSGRPTPTTARRPR